MFLISFSSIEISSWYFRKTKAPKIPAGNWSRYFFKISYPRRLKKFLLTASLATLLGAMKEIRLSRSDLDEFINLKVKLGKFKNFPSLKSKSISFLLALFFFLSILVPPQAWIKQTISFCLFGVFFWVLFFRSWFWTGLKTRVSWLFFFF